MRTSLALSALSSIALLGLGASAAAQDVIGQAPPAPALGIEGTAETLRPDAWPELGEVLPMGFPTPTGEPELVTEIERARASVDARDVAGAAILERLLADHPRAEATRSALLTLAITYQMAGEGAAAADAYARFARLFPADELARDAARHAIALDLSLDRVGRAREGANRFARNYGRRRPDETASVVSSIGAALERRGQRRALVAHDRHWLRRWGERAPLALRIHVMARLVRALPASRTSDALQLQRHIVALWDGQDASDLREDAEAKRRVAVDVARALLALADVERGLAEALPFPTLRRRRPRTEELARWARERLTPWLQTRMNGLHRAERAYARLSELGPTEPLVVAAVEVGEMYVALATTFDQAPLSAEIADDPELLAVYRSAIDTYTEPLKQRAIQAFELALSLAERHGFSGPPARRALADLRALDPARSEAAEQSVERGSL